MVELFVEFIINELLEVLFIEAKGDELFIVSIDELSVLLREELIDYVVLAVELVEMVQFKLEFEKPDEFKLKFELVVLTIEEVLVV